MNAHWRCPGCWEMVNIAKDCPRCGRGSRGIGLYRHPPVDPKTGEISAEPNAISMGSMRHCDVPEPHYRGDCTAIMDDHGWVDTGGLGVTICPPYGLGYTKIREQIPAVLPGHVYTAAKDTDDAEINAMSLCVNVLKHLEPVIASQVAGYLHERFSQ